MSGWTISHGARPAGGLQRPLARPLEVTRPCLAVRQDGIDVNGRTIAFGGCIEVEPPHPVVFAWGWEGILILPNPSICCPAMAPAHASTGRTRPLCWKPCVGRCCCDGNALETARSETACECRTAWYLASSIGHAAPCRA